MSSCRRCQGPLSVAASCFPGFDLLQCEPCERPIRLIIKTGPRMPGLRPLSKADHNRAMRAARRMRARRSPTP